MTTAFRSEPIVFAFPSNPETGCPHCGGFLVPERSARRCVRCGFTECDTCDWGRDRGRDDERED